MLTNFNVAPTLTLSSQKLLDCVLRWPQFVSPRTHSFLIYHRDNRVMHKQCRARQQSVCDLNVLSSGLRQHQRIIISRISLRRFRQMSTRPRCACAECSWLSWNAMKISVLWLANKTEKMTRMTWQKLCTQIRRLAVPIVSVSSSASSRPPVWFEKVLLTIVVLREC